MASTKRPRSATRTQPLLRDCKRPRKIAAPRLPADVWAHVVMPWLTHPDVDGTSTDVLALAVTCHELYDYPQWRRFGCRRMVIGKYMGEEQLYWRLAEQQQVMFDRLYAPHVEELVYHLPCRHDWSVLSLDAMTRLHTLELHGDTCGSPTWPLPFPATLRLLRLDKQISPDDYVGRPGLWVNAHPDLLLDSVHVSLISIAGDAGAYWLTTAHELSHIKITQLHDDYTLEDYHTASRIDIQVLRETREKFTQ